MKYEQVSLSQYPYQPIQDFAAASNYFLDRNTWTLFVADDEEPSLMLLNYLDQLEPKYPYYAVRVINLRDGRYLPQENPLIGARLVSNQGPRFIGQKKRGRLHERIIPRKPFGMIDYPIIHDHTGPTRYRNPWYWDLPFYRAWFVSKKLLEVARGY